MSDDKKNKAIEKAMALIESKFGKGAIMKMDGDNIEKINAIPTGSIALDSALGIGGFPEGRIVEIYGNESSGKTTLTLHAIAEAQKLGKTCAFIDAEHALDVSYAQKLGVNINELLISQPDYGEQALSIAEKLAESGAVDVIVIDSVAALTPKAEIEGEMGDSHVGLQARLMSQGLRKLTGVVKANNVLCVFINQIRMKIGVMFGNPETTSGGNALKFYSSVRIEVRKSTAVKEGDEVVANVTKFKVVKNKVAPPFKEAETQIKFGVGIDQGAEVLDYAVKFEIIEKSGAWYSYGGSKIGQGKLNAQAHIEGNPELYAEIKDQVLAKLGLK